MFSKNPKSLATLRANAKRVLISKIPLDGTEEKAMCRESINKILHKMRNKQAFYCFALFLPYLKWWLLSNSNRLTFREKKTRCKKSLKSCKWQELERAVTLSMSEYLCFVAKWNGDDGYRPIDRWTNEHWTEFLLNHIMNEQSHVNE